MSFSISLDRYPALVLNADYRPLSYFPLSLWPWHEAVKAAFLDRVNILSEYDRLVRSPSCEMRLPSVISLKRYVPMTRRPAFTRFNVFLRDRFRCQYCAVRAPTEELTFDHVVPRSRGGVTSWKNVVAACSRCNLHKGNTTHQIDPLTGRLAQLFHPRIDSWNEHFRWDEDGTRLLASTATGRVTLLVLNMNNEEILEARRRWVAVGWHP